MGWAPKFSHNISLFYPEAILNYFGILPSVKYYTVLLARVTAIIEVEVLSAADTLNGLIRRAFYKDLLDIDEYVALPQYWEALDTALSSPAHVGVVWGPKLVQAKFIDTDILGGLPELIDIQKEVYPMGTGNVGAWASLYVKWLSGENDAIGETLRQRTSIMISRGQAPFAELIESGNDMYPAYPRHPGKHTLRDFKPVYNREMSAAYHRTIQAVEALVATSPSSMLEPISIVAGDTVNTGVVWISNAGNTIFAFEESIKLINNRFVGNGFVMSETGDILREWHGWLPK